ncbi:LysR family transcriptional regulator [Variovorax sp. E3]|uniref:LysR family transcriptional regulator n=1 Tax=Variovorax sp. E3 TaxID=1914993 RepID=UPI0018DCC45B|nr:LysR family transcriptional regulator [Variovorax sp. E3]
MSKLDDASGAGQKRMDRSSAGASSCVGVHTLVRRMDLFTLRLFLSVAEEGQIGRAAAREHVVPSAATRRIQELEDLAGTKLLERNAKGVVLSAAGHIVARHATSVLKALDAMQTELAAQNPVVLSILKIVSTRLQIVYFLADQLGELVRRFPQANVDLREESYKGTLRVLLAGEAELAVFDVRGSDIQLAGIQSRECRKDDLVAVMPKVHPLASKGSVSLEMLLEQDLIGTRPDSCLMENLREAAKGVGRDLRVKRSVDTIEAARSLVGAGLGIALQPSCGTLSLEERERLVAVPISGEWAKLSYRVGWREGKELSALALKLVHQLTAAPPAEETQGLPIVTPLQE